MQAEDKNDGPVVFNFTRSKESYYVAQSKNTEYKYKVNSTAI